TITPVTSSSSRCTGWTTCPVCRRKRSGSVGPLRPGAGTTRRRAGLATTRRCSSWWRMRIAGGTPARLTVADSVQLQLVDLDLAVEGRPSDAQELRRAADIALRRLERARQEPPLLGLQRQDLL